MQFALIVMAIPNEWIIPDIGDSSFNHLVFAHCAHMVNSTSSLMTLV